MAEQSESAPPAQSGGLLAMAVPPVIAGAAAFAVTVWAPWSVSPDMGEDLPETTAGYAPGALEGGDAAEGDASAPELPVLAGSDAKKSRKGKGESGKTLSLLPLEPLIVSLAESSPSQSTRPIRIRLSVSVEGEESILEKGEVISILLRDEFTRTVRTISPDVLGSSGGLEKLRAALVDSARNALGEDAVSNILITDFLMT